MSKREEITQYLNSLTEHFNVINVAEHQYSDEHKSECDSCVKLRENFIIIHSSIFNQVPYFVSGSSPLVGGLEGTVDLTQADFDFELDVLETILRSLYRKRINFDSKSTVNLMNHAGFLRLENLFACSCSLLVTNSTPERAALMLPKIIDSKYDKHRKIVEDFVLKDFSRVWRRSDLSRWSAEDVEFYLRSDKLAVSGEAEVFEFLLTFAEVTDESMERVLPLLEHVRFEFCTHQSVIALIDKKASSLVVHGGKSRAEFLQNMKNFKEFFVLDRRSSFYLKCLDRLYCEEDRVAAYLRGKARKYCKGAYIIEEVKNDVSGERSMIFKRYSAIDFSVQELNPPPVHDPAFAKYVCVADKLYALVDNLNGERTDLHVFDEKLNTWQLFPPLIVPQRRFPAVCVFGGKIVVAGGRCRVAAYQSQIPVEVFDPQQNEWRLICGSFTPSEESCSAAMCDVIKVFASPAKFKEQHLSLYVVHPNDDFRVEEVTFSRNQKVNKSVLSPVYSSLEIDGKSLFLKGVKAKQAADKYGALEKKTESFGINKLKTMLEGAEINLLERSNKTKRFGIEGAKVSVDLQIARVDDYYIAMSTNLHSYSPDGSKEFDYNVIKLNLCKDTFKLVENSEYKSRKTANTTLLGFKLINNGFHD